MNEDVKPTRILIVDDHPIVRHGLTQLIAQESDMMVCGEASSEEEALQALAESEPDVVLIDITLKDSNGINLIKQIRSQDADLALLVLSMHDESLYAERALRAGANGYVMKQQADEAVIEGIRKVLAGELFVSDEVSAKMLRQYIGGPAGEGSDSALRRLSDRELVVFGLIGRGLSTQKIADKLELSVKTVEAHRAHIKKKLEIDDAAQLVHRAVRWVESEGA